MPLHIGVARADITPPVGIPMVGFAGRGPSLSVHDPLTATALVAAEGEQRIALICTDLLSLDAATVADFRRAIEEASGVPAARVMLHCAHNHFGPDVDRATDVPVVAAYQAHLKHVLAGLVYEAAQRLQEAHLGVGWGESDIGINRRERKPDGRIVLGRNPQGPIDRRVGVARFDEPGGPPLAALANFACHPVCQTGRMRALSADFPGRMRHVVEQLTGAPCLFLQGASGNINPVIMETAYEPARTLGTRLGCAVTGIWETVTTAPAEGVGAASHTAALPAYRFGSLEQARQRQADLEQYLRESDEPDAPSSRRRWTEQRLERVRQAVASWESGESRPPLEAELQALRLGSLHVAAAPGEIFNEIGVAVKKQSPAEHTFFAGYANGSIGYVPVPEAYDEGGYEVADACRVDPEAAGLIQLSCLEALRQLD